ncbi:uncharacterized protein LOC133814131 [Humulus lupulus]|uniref:uncharacterized protein LOC133814131 n=1 Tax=Humulus lupulus TaxID=3486 RepID=UPI002B40963C|nr:uncharacterized protein LOC133814131 [Humulus lupulus]
MNSHYGSSSYLASSSSSSNDDDYYDDLEKQVVCQITANNNFCITQHQNNEGSHRGSIPGHIVVNRDRENANHNLFNDYFAENPRFSASMFRRRFRMGRALFLHIYDVVQRHDNYFVQRRDGLGKLGLSGLQKVTVVFRMLAYGVPADATDEYIKIGESTALESLKRFYRVVVAVFGARYLRSPNADDVARLLHIGESRGFPGMLGSLDCMHWKWKNCPTAWGGQYAGRSGSPTIILEAVADYDLWIWYAYFGLPGSNNDINVLEASHLFADLAAGVSPPANYVIKGKEYNMGYYLADGPARLWNKRILHDIMTSCIIMHNMIIEDERNFNAPIEERFEVSNPEVEKVGNDDARFQEFLARYRKIKDKDAHIALRNALIKHLWDEYSIGKLV